MKVQHSKQTSYQGKLVASHYINPLTPISDQDKISPYNIKTISTR